MALDTAYIKCDGVQYAVTGLVDEESRRVFEVSVWLHPPIPGVDPLIERFSPNEAQSERQFAGLDALNTLYSINPVLVEE